MEIRRVERVQVQGSRFSGEEEFKARITLMLVRALFLNLYAAGVIIKHKIHQTLGERFRN